MRSNKVTQIADIKINLACGPYLSWREQEWEILAIRLHHPMRIADLDEIPVLGS